MTGVLEMLAAQLSTRAPAQLFARFGPAVSYPLLPIPCPFSDTWPCFVRLRKGKGCFGLMFQTARRPAATSLPSLIVPWNRRSACPLYSSCRNVVFLLHCPPSLSPLLLHAHLSSLRSNDSVSVAAAARPGYYHHCSRAASCRCGFCNRCQLLFDATVLQSPMSLCHASAMPRLLQITARLD